MTQAAANDNENPKVTKFPGSPHVQISTLHLIQYERTEKKYRESLESAA